MEMENRHFDRTGFCSGLCTCRSPWSFLARFVPGLRRHDSAEAWWNWVWSWGGAEECSILPPLRAAWGAPWGPSYETPLLSCACLAGKREDLRNNVLVLQLIFNSSLLFASLPCWTHSLWINCSAGLYLFWASESLKEWLTFMGIDFYWKTNK